VDGEPAIKTLIANTDPALVSFEFDTYWALFAGFDPVEFITKHGPRISLLHIKDMDAADRSFAPIGTGTLPLDEIITASVTAGVRYLIVEQDTTKGPELDAVKISYDNLKAKGYV
jgi:sugar phosphate isomerase/epimerase